MRKQVTFDYGNIFSKSKTNMTAVVCYYHVKYEFQSESTLYSLSECQGTHWSMHALYLKFK